MNENDNTKQRVILTPEEIAMSDRNKKKRKQAIGKIELFLSQVLSLQMHADKRYLQQVSHGVLYVMNMRKICVRKAYKEIG